MKITKNPTNRNEEYKWTRTKYNTAKGSYVTNINKYNVIDIINKHRITMTGDKIIEIEEK